MTGGYTGATNFSSPIAGRQAWGGVSDGGATSVCHHDGDLPPGAAGVPTVLRWRVATDISVAATGQWVDNITFTTCGSVCAGAPVTSPDEVTGDTFASDKQTYSWSAVALATQYDVLRGDLSALPVGPGGGDEICFDNVAGTSTVDISTPSPGSGRFYLVRGQNTCAAPGTYGTTSSLTPRTSTTCP